MFFTEKFGFNKQTLALFFADKVKSLGRRHTIHSDIREREREAFLFSLFFHSHSVFFFFFSHIMHLLIVSLPVLKVVIGVPFLSILLYLIKMGGGAEENIPI